MRSRAASETVCECAVVPWCRGAVVVVPWCGARALSVHCGAGGAASGTCEGTGHWNCCESGHHTELILRVVASYHYITSVTVYTLRLF